MHNNDNYQCKMCWNKALTFGVGSIKLIFRTNTCKDVFNPNVISFQSNCAEGLHFILVLFIIIMYYMTNERSLALPKWICKGTRRRTR